jgi:GFO/IDH/MocA C-terminal domain
MTSETSPWSGFPYTTVLCDLDGTLIDSHAAHTETWHQALREHDVDATLALEPVRRGRIGEPKFFNSSFSWRVRLDNIRTRKAMGVFGREPKEVMAISVNSGPAALSEIDESTGALLRFDGDRVAAFVTSFNAADVGSYQIVGTKGDLRVDPAYDYVDALGYELTIKGKTTRVRGRKADQGAAELLYFSDCILRGRRDSRAPA